MSSEFKIVLLGSFNEGALEHSFYRGFVGLGYNVVPFDITEKFYKDFEKFHNKLLYRFTPSVLFKEINENILNFCKEQRPQFIFICKGTTVFPATILELKKYCRLVVNYNPDHPTHLYSRGSGNELIKKSVSNYDILFTYSKKIASELNHSGAVCAHWIPFGFDSLKPFKKVEQSQNFLFVGTCDNERVKNIEQLGRSDIKVYGDQEWVKRSSPKSIVRTCFQNKPLYGDDLALETSKAIGTFNFLRPQNIVEDSHNMRTFEIPSMGGLQITRITPEQEEFFENEKEIIFYNSVEEMNDKVNFIKANPVYAQKIKANGYARCVKSNYSFKARCAEMISIMQNHCS